MYLKEDVSNNDIRIYNLLVKDQHVYICEGTKAHSNGPRTF